MSILAAQGGVGAQVRVSFCRGIRAKDGQITSPIWSAATCRRFHSDARAIAATSRRTPKELWSFVCCWPKRRLRRLPLRTIAPRRRRRRPKL